MCTQLSFHYSRPKETRANHDSTNALSFHFHCFLYFCLAVIVVSFPEFVCLVHVSEYVYPCIGGVQNFSFGIHRRETVVLFPTHHHASHDRVPYRRRNDLRPRRQRLPLMKTTKRRTRPEQRRRRNEAAPDQIDRRRWRERWRRR